MPRLLASLLLIVALSNLVLPVSSFAAADAFEAWTPGDTASGTPRLRGTFDVGPHLSLANSAGFKLMWGYVPWQGIEPSRGSFLFP